MRIAGMEGFGAPDVLHIVEAPKPEPKADEVLIRVEAAGVSRADVLQRQGKYPPPRNASPVLGLDVAGTVEQVGEAVTRWKAGDAVVALVNGGGYAEYCVAPASQVLPLPPNWTLAEAATLPENVFTVFDNLVTRGRLKRGERVLVHGGTSGLGSMALMLARMFGAIPYTTAGSDAKCAACRKIGAEAAINYKTADFVAAVRDLTDGHGVDVVLDIIGGKYLEKNLDALALEGRLGIIATLGGDSATLPITKLMMKRAWVFGSTLRARTSEEKRAIAEKLLAEVWPQLPDKQTLRPLIDSEFSLDQAAKAHERMEQGDHVGKILLRL
jgi:NADPH:quinone reductase